MSDLSRMTGTPWHTEKMVRAEGDDRRHRSRCSHYDRKNKYCFLHRSNCWGAQHCEYYKEAVEKNDDYILPKSVQKPASSPRMQLFHVGDKCEHKTFGRGYVTHIEGDRITIEFENVGMKKFSINAILANGLVTIIKG